MNVQDPRWASLGEAMRLAIGHEEAGRLDEAEAIYRAVLRSEPGHTEASYNLGLLALRRGMAQEAVPVLQLAVQREPRNPAHWLHYAVALAKTGQPAAARQTLLEAKARGIGGMELSSLLEQLERVAGAPSGVRLSAAAGDSTAAPDAAEYSVLNDLYRQQRFEEVEVRARALLTRYPKGVGLARLLGSALLSQLRLESACEFLEQARVTFPGDARIEYLLGLALRKLGRRDEARAAFERSLAADPADTGTLLNAAGLALVSEDLATARRHAETVLALQANRVDALRILADVAFAEGRFADAASYYGQAFGLRPDAAELCLGHRDALFGMGRSAEATDMLARVLARRKHDDAFLGNLAQACFERGETSAALGYFRAASERASADEHLMSDYLLCLLHEENVSPGQCFAEHRRVAGLLEAPRRAKRRAHDNLRDPERGLRIGFVSADLHDHPVAYLIEPVWQALRCGRNEIFAYANMTFEDEVSRRLRTLVDRWQRIERLDDEMLATQIRGDRIDVLFDLSGHTGGNRLGVFAMKPAPVQVSWIGYPATTGLSAIDYRFVHTRDSTAGAIEPLFSERLVRLRHRGIRPEIVAPPVNRLPALSNGRLTFGSFARPAKISESTLALWSRVLHAIPSSRLLIAAVLAAPARRRLRTLFTEQGVGPDRLDFRPRMALGSYLALHHEVDIVLDTLPFAGETTTHHALWMGVPVLTRIERTLHQNQGGDILQALGMSEWAAGSDEGFVGQAVSVAGRLAELDALRQRLRADMTRVFVDSAPAVRDELEQALRTIWRRWCDGLDAEAFMVQ